MIQELFQGFSNNVIQVISIIILTEAIKKIDVKKLLKKFYVILPMLLSIPITILSMKDLAFRETFYQILVNTGIAVYFYDIVKKTIDNTMENK